MRTCRGRTSRFVRLCKASMRPLGGGGTRRWILSRFIWLDRLARFSVYNQIQQRSVKIIIINSFSYVDLYCSVLCCRICFPTGKWGFKSEKSSHRSGNFREGRARWTNPNDIFARDKWNLSIATASPVKGELQMSSNGWTVSRTLVLDLCKIRLQNLKFTEESLGARLINLRIKYKRRR